MVSDMDLVTRLREILRSSDLDTATPASVRRQLEADFGVDLTDRKGFIRDQIDIFLESNSGVEEKPEIPKAEEDINADETTQPEAEVEEDDDDGDGSESDEEKEERPVKAKKRGGGFTKICQLSPQLDKFLGTSQLARTEPAGEKMASTSASSSTSDREFELEKEIKRQEVSIDELSSLSSSRSVYQKTGNLFFRTTSEKAKSNAQKQLDFAKSEIGKIRSQT